MIKRLFALFATIITLLLISFAIYLYSTLSRPLGYLNDEFSINPGDSISSVSNRLYQSGAIRDHYSFKLLAVLKGESRNIKAGIYQIDPQMSAIDLLNKFTKGEVIKFKVQLTEGLTFKQFREKLNSVPELTHLTKDWSDEKIMQEIGAAILHPEGQFFPDTYVFRKNDSDISILKRAWQTMQDHLNDNWQKRDKQNPLKNEYEALKLASIIEKETGQASERGLIGGVFTNRLNKGMLLQTDPTIIYGLGDSFDGNLKRRHLRAKNNKYNTYVYPGLPPTPIAMPGLASIQAALNPQETDYFYFVGKGDGSHAFSKSYKEHVRAVNKYQLKK